MNDQRKQLSGGAVLRLARPGDEDGILDCIRKLAEYEREPDAVQTTAGDLRQTLFGPAPSVFAHVVDRDGEIIAIAVWFLNYSTWTGRNGIYLEDLFVRPEHRGHGLGKALLAAVARLADERDCGRLEWAVLDWNEPALRFYRSLGAVPQDDWTLYRLSGNALQKMAQSENRP